MCGLTHWISVTRPSTSVTLSIWNTAANEWCAAAGSENDAQSSVAAADRFRGEDGIFATSALSSAADHQVQRMTRGRLCHVCRVAPNRRARRAGSHYGGAPHGPLEPKRLRSWCSPVAQLLLTRYRSARS